MIKWEKFHVGDHVKIVRLLDQTTTPKLIGKTGVIWEIDDLPNGDYNYTLSDGTYVHEEELELDIPATVIDRLKGGR
jgi:hypothetical protein